MGVQYLLVCAFLSANILYMGCLCDGYMSDSRVPFNISRNIMPKETLSHLGREFILGFMNPSYSQKEARKFEIFINALENNTEVRVHIPYLYFNKKYVLRKKEVIGVDIPKEVSMARETKLETKGVGISANKAIVVYAFSKVNISYGYERSKEDGFLVFPRRSLGYEYVATSYTGSHSDLGIVGVQNNTNVSIVLKSHPGVTYRQHGYRSGDTLNITLNELQTFRIRSHEDLSGVRVIADKPVAVFSGASCELSKIGPNCGNIVDQLPAVKTWGQKYIVYSGRSNSVDGGIVRITSAAENTVVLLDNGRTMKLGIGSVMDLVVKPRWPTLISCTPHCMTALYNTHLSRNRCSGRIHSSKGCHVGPSMTILPATTQFLPYYSVYIPIDRNHFGFLTIMIKCSAANSLVLNGVLLGKVAWKTSEFKTWCGITIEVRKHGVNTLYHQDGSTSFGVMVTGIGEKDSYTYIAGRSFKVVENKTVSLQAITPTLDAKSSSIISVNNLSKADLHRYKYAAIALSVFCGILLLLLAVLWLRYRAKQSAKAVEKDTTINTKPITESEYQSIRGLPRRNTHSYEEVKFPPKPNSRAAIINILPPSLDSQDYQNINVQKNRDSNPYVPMDQALPGRPIANHLSAMAEQEDIYLTMKKFIKKPQDKEKETAEVQE